MDLTQKIFFSFVVFDQFNVLLLIMLLYCHKIVEYIIRTTLSNKILISKGRVTNKPCSHLSKNRRAELLWTMVLQFLLQEKEDRRSKAHWSCSFLSKEPLSKGATDMNELGYIETCLKWNVPLKKRRNKLLSIRVLEFSIKGKGGLKKQSPRIQEFLIKETIA